MHASTTPTAAVSQRRIVHQTRGQTHGPITRLVSPSDLGESLKPFVFLDLFETDPQAFSGFGMHPHSGIATLTLIQQDRSRTVGVKASRLKAGWDTGYLLRLLGAS